MRQPRPWKAQQTAPRRQKGRTKQVRKVKTTTCSTHTHTHTHQRQSLPTVEPSDDNFLPSDSRQSATIPRQAWEILMPQWRQKGAGIDGGPRQVPQNERRKTEHRMATTRKRRQMMLLVCRAMHFASLCGLAKSHRVCHPHAAHFPTQRQRRR